MVASPLRIAQAGATRRERRGIEYARWTRPQRSLLSDLSPVVVWRDGNQLGKSYWLAAEAIHTARGTHPFWRGHRPPCEVVVMGVSLEQMVPLMEKIWELVPRDELDPRNSFDPGRGITGKPPRLVFVKGPGKGSVIKFATYKQGAKRLAGATVALVIMDEPPDEKVYGEVVPRVFRKGGRIRIGMTPTPDMPDVTWLKKKVKEGHVIQHNYGLSEANLWIEGAPGPFLTQAEVDAFEAQLLPVEREMRMGRSWDVVPTERWLANFDPTTCVAKVLPPEGAMLGVGIDHGQRAGKQTAVLCAFWGYGSTMPRVIFLDEEVSDERTTARQDAEGILRMLKRNGFRYRDVDLWVGDRPLSQSAGAQKSNQQLRSWFARLEGLDLQQVAPIPTPKKFGGSEFVGLRLLNSMFGTLLEDGTPTALVHQRCTGLAKSCLTYQGKKDDPVKDRLDAARYILERIAREQGTAVNLRY